jgi:hypothetical protein
MKIPLTLLASLAMLGLAMLMLSGCVPLLVGGAIGVGIESQHATYCRHYPYDRHCRY